MVHVNDLTSRNSNATMKSSQAYLVGENSIVNELTKTTEGLIIQFSFAFFVLTFIFWLVFFQHDHEMR